MQFNCGIVQCTQFVIETSLWSARTFSNSVSDCRQKLMSNPALVGVASLYPVSLALLHSLLYSVCVHLSPCNCYKESLCSDKHVQIALLIGNVQ